jgi:hypothetical protein
MVHDTDGEGLFILAVRDSSLGGKRLNARWDIIGFMWKQEAMNPIWWSDPNTGRPAFWVPQESLRPIEELTANLTDYLGAAELMAVG